jgi:hypothetical protein
MTVIIHTSLTVIIHSHHSQSSLQVIVHSHRSQSSFTFIIHSDDRRVISTVHRYHSQSLFAGIAHTSHRDHTVIITLIIHSDDRRVIHHHSQSLTQKTKSKFLWSLGVEIDNSGIVPSSLKQILETTYGADKPKVSSAAMLVHKRLFIWCAFHCIFCVLT